MWVVAINCLLRRHPQSCNFHLCENIFAFCSCHFWVSLCQSLPLQHGFVSGKLRRKSWGKKTNKQLSGKSWVERWTRLLCVMHGIKKQWSELTPNFSDQHHVGGPSEGFTDRSNVVDSTQAEAPKEYDGNGRVCHVHCHWCQYTRKEFVWKLFQTEQNYSVKL